jgi:hypothetical protein
MGRLGHQVRLALHGIDSKNLLEHHPPQHQEYSGIEEKAVGAPTDPDEPNSSGWGLSGYVTSPGVNIIGS